MSHPILARIASAVDAARSLPALWSARQRLELPPRAARCAREAA